MALRHLCGAKWGPSAGSVRSLYCAHVESHIRFGLGIWFSLAPEELLSEIDRLILHCAHTITGLPGGTSRVVTLHKSKLWSLGELHVIESIQIVERAHRLRCCSLRTSILNGVLPHDLDHGLGLAQEIRDAISDDSFLNRDEFPDARQIAESTSNWTSTHFHPETIESEEEFQSFLLKEKISHAAATDGAVR